MENDFYAFLNFIDEIILLFWGLNLVQNSQFLNLDYNDDLRYLNYINSFVDFLIIDFKF